jgi:hypothetical protein
MPVTSVIELGLQPGTELLTAAFAEDSLLVRRDILSSTRTEKDEVART